MPVVVKTLEVVEEEQELFVTEPHLYLDLRQQQFRSELVECIFIQKDQMVMEHHHILEHQ